MIVPAIDNSKAYPRGAFVHHRGGLLRSICNTVPLEDHTLEQAGWEVIINGIADIKVDFGEDMRTFGIGVELTDGKTTVQTFRLPP